METLVNFFLATKWGINRLFICYVIAISSFTVILLSGLYFFSAPLPNLQELPVESTSQIHQPFYPYELIGSSALALHEYHTSSWARRIANELLVLGYNTRPGQQEQVSIVFSLDKGKSSFISQNGGLIFLKEALEGLAYSKEKTALWIQPLLLDNGSILIKASRQFQSTEQSTEFVSSCSLGIIQAPEMDCIKQLEGSAYFNSDLLVQHYGGSEFTTWKEKGVLKCANSNGSYACFVSEMDILVFKGDEWQVASTEIKTEGFPIAQVKMLSPQGMQLEVWDEKGFYSHIVNLPVKQKKMRKKLDIPLTKVRMRSSTRVSCSLGKKRFFLRQGDWLYKTSSGWHRLDKPKDFERVLYHRLVAEVFIFDSIVKEQGCFFMKGSLFDETRTQMQQMQLPIQIKKKKQK